VLSCEASHAPPVYLVRFSGGARPTFALMRFDIAAIELFDSELPLGLIAMGGTRGHTVDGAQQLSSRTTRRFDAPRPAAGRAAGPWRGA
jgi:hypothetical protein